MFPANSHTIRVATADDAETLRRLAQLDSSRELTGRVLIAEDDGAPVAALSLDEGRAVADPFRHTGVALILLRMRASAVTAYERTPSLRERMIAGTRIRRPRAAYGEA